MNLFQVEENFLRSLSPQSSGDNMSIVRIQHDKDRPYVLLNKKALNDQNLSLAAVGLWARLLSRPDDWQIYTKELTKSCGCGRDKIHSLLRELIQNGYCYRHREKVAGKHIGCDYTVFESKQSERDMDKFKKTLPQPCFPYTAKPPLLKTNMSSLSEKTVSAKAEDVAPSAIARDGCLPSDKKTILDSEGNLKNPPSIEYEKPSGKKSIIKLNDIDEKIKKSQCFRFAWALLSVSSTKKTDALKWIKETQKNLIKQLEDGEDKFVKRYYSQEEVEKWLRRK